MISLSKKILVDSCVWIAAYYKQDKYHEKGKLFIEWLKSQRNVEIIIIDNIIIETLTFLRKKAKDPATVNEVANIFMEDDRIEVYITSEEAFYKGLEIFRKYKALSVVDSIIVVFYLNLNPDYLLSYDVRFNSYNEIIRFEEPQ
ncbi:hypothetical protein LCGC14_2144160 [marine sediment metagenome]|uniref:PIN domain-containing protein n=1 Tax=marine sediment metagenome TaxID=412755 RepID=A0A0F9DXH4_9ZZZZ